ncbi:MAG: 5'/3'-nucleotidase SurE [Lachnospiraceae bacterium]|nr:5'/3'-nucleotidase SurE [Lachnospiraceae bacterium]
MRILITNDDGILAEGLIRLAEAAKALGEVWVVAPDGERSAASHSITLRDPLDVYPVPEFPVKGVHAFSCTGTPADCVRVGSLAVMPEKPEVLLSGINYGFNTASDIQYSATCGAAFEGAFQGMLSIAVSEKACPCHEVTDRQLLPVLEELIRCGKPEGNHTIYNVNFPGCRAEEFRGVLRERSVSQSTFYHDSYKSLQKLENGGVRYMVEGLYQETCEEGTDMRAVVEGYVSIGIVRNVGSA